MKKAIIAGTTQIRFTFDGCEAVTFDANKCSEANNDYAVMHGYLARIGDSAALSRTLPDGTVRTITEAMRREAIVEMVTHLESGSTEWNLKGGSRALAQNPTILAIAAKKGCTYAEAEAMLAAQFLNELA